MVSLAIFVLPISGALAGDPATTPSGSDRMAAVGQLLFRSSASRQVTGSGGEQSLAAYGEARGAYEKAQEADRRGDEEEKMRLLGEASRKMFEAVRLASPGAVVDRKKKADFQRRLESLQQMIQAHERIREEKKSDAGKTEMDGPVRDKLDEAKSLFAEGRTDEARKALDQAYASARVALGKLRGGDTVVRTLNFSSKEDEYRYELDRNDTHQMLLKTVLAEKADRPELAELGRPFVDEAAELRKQAEAEAAAGRHEQAVEILEKSTSRLIRALRAAGVFVPG